MAFTEQQLATWENRCRIEFEAVLVEARDKLNEHGNAVPGHLVISWGRRAFDALQYEI